MLSALKHYPSLASLGDDLCQPSSNFKTLSESIIEMYCAVKVLRLVEKGWVGWTLAFTELTVEHALGFQIGLNKSRRPVFFWKPPTLGFGNINRQDRVSQEKPSDTKLLMRASWFFSFRTWSNKCLTSGGQFGLYGNVPFWRPEIPPLQCVCLDCMINSVQPRAKSSSIVGNWAVKSWPEQIWGWDRNSKMWSVVFCLV